MIKLEDIKGRKALSLLWLYEGRNPYLLNLKETLTAKGKISLTPTQDSYIIDNYDKDPIKVDRVIGVSAYLGEELQKKDGTSFIPQRIYVGFVLAETEKSYHVFGKLTQNQVEFRMYWLPKTQVMIGRAHV